MSSIGASEGDDQPAPAQTHLRSLAAVEECQADWVATPLLPLSQSNPRCCFAAAHCCFGLRHRSFGLSHRCFGLHMFGLHPLGLGLIETAQKNSAPVVVRGGGWD